MRRITAIICIITMLFCGCYVASAGSSDEQQFIRVGICEGDGDYDITSSDGFKIYSYADGNVQAVASIAGSPDEIRVRNDGIYVNIFTDASPTKAVYSYANDCNYFIGCSDITNGIMSVEGVFYRCGVRPFKSSDGKHRIINVINIEKYLYGVLPREMSSSYPLEALKAQAVAARSFAGKNIGRHSSLGYDVCNTQCCQVYGGVSSEVAKCSGAVNETRGMYAYYDDEPICCYYSANNGGGIESSKDVWGTDLPYLQAGVDEYTPDLKWTVVYSADELSSLLDSAGYKVGKVTSVSILARTDGGSVSRLQFNGTGGSAVLEKNKIRSVLGTSKLKTLHFDVSRQGESGTTVDNAMYYVRNVNGSTAEKNLTGLAVIGEDGNIVRLSSSAVEVQGSNTVVSLSGILSEIASSEPRAIVDELVIYGKGNGHCIGMSQQGARAMAESGFTYDEILKYYYTGIEIK